MSFVMFFSKVTFCMCIWYYWSICLNCGTWCIAKWCFIWQFRRYTPYSTPISTQRRDGSDAILFNVSEMFSQIKKHFPKHQQLNHLMETRYKNLPRTRMRDNQEHSYDSCDLSCTRKITGGTFIMQHCMQCFIN